MTPEALELLSEAITVEFWLLHIHEPGANPLGLFAVRSGSHTLELELNGQSLKPQVKHNGKVLK